MVEVERTMEDDGVRWLDEPKIFSGIPHPFTLYFSLNSPLEIRIVSLFVFLDTCTGYEVKE